jgi:RNA polymerase sigma-70 factor, ECF subfamily
MSNSAHRLADLHAQFHALVLPQLGALLAFARRRTASHSDAEDAVQEACVRAWTAFAELRDATKVRPWLYRILRSVLSDALARDGRRRLLVSITRLEDAHEALVAGDENALFTEVAERLSSEMVHDALATIPEDFAIAVELHDIDGFKYREIAEIVGVPIGTVMSRINRGRQLLAGAIAAGRATWAPGAQPRAAAGGQARPRTR